MASKKQVTPKERKIFINNLNTWFSNFVIEEFRTDYLPDEKTQNIIMGTMDDSSTIPLPRLFEPKLTSIELGYNYDQEIFENDIFIYNLDDAELSEVEYVIRGLQNIKVESEKILVIVSNIMTWAKTPLKTFSDEERAAEGFNEEEVPEEEEEKVPKSPVIPVGVEEIKEDKEEEDKKSEDSKTKNDKNGKRKLEKKISKKFDSANKDNQNQNQKQTDAEKPKKSEEEKLNTISEGGQKENSEENPDQLQGEQSHENDSQKSHEETPPPEEPPKPKIKTYYYKDNEYNKRIPDSRYYYYKLLETLALTNTNPLVKTYIICPGFVYGCGESFFFDYFRLVWMRHLDYVPIIGEGLNHIPTIHIFDLVKLIRRVIERKPKMNYIFACDRTKNPSVKNILKSIGKGIGGIDIKLLKDFNVDEYDIPNFTELSINVQIKTPSIFEDEKRIVGESIEEYKKRAFPWHCEMGIPENINKLREEFNLYRNLKPIRIIITGPPCGGKSTLAQRLSEQFKISHLTIDQVCEWAKTLDTPLGDETREKLAEIEENINKALDEYEHRKNKRRTDPPLDVSPFKKFSSEFMGKILKEKLNTGECGTKGYILDNYPKTYEDCINLFSNSVFDKEKEGPYEINKNLLPNSIIIIDPYDEESLKEKLKKLPGYEENSLPMDTRFFRRITTYKETNTVSDDNKKVLKDFYKDNNLDVYLLNETDYMSNKEEEENKIFKYLERNGPIDNYSKLHDDEEIIPFIELEKLENIEKKDEENKEKLINDELITGGINGSKILTKEEAIKGINEEEKMNNNNPTKDKQKDVNINQSVNKSKDKDKEKKPEEDQENNNNKKEENKNNEDNNNDLDEKDKDKENKEGNNNNNNKQEEEKKEEGKSSEIEIGGEGGNQAKGGENTSGNEIISGLCQQEKIIQDKLHALKEREKNLLEKKSEVLRRYLSENVMPLLARGIVHVCQKLPDDPVEALANYLLESSFDLQKETNKSNNDLEKIINISEHL